MAYDVGVARLEDRQLFERLPDPTFTVDRNGRVIDANPAATRAFDRAREELLGAEFAGCFSDPEWARGEFARVLANGGASDITLTVRSSTSGERLFSLNAAALRDPEGRATGFVATARDVSLQRDLESRLRASQFYNRSIIEASPRALLVVDPDLVVTDVNEQSSQYIGYPRKELIGRPLTEVFTLSESDRDRFQLTLAEGIRSEFELTLTPRSGEPRSIPVSATAFLDPGGEPRGVLAIGGP